MRRFAFGLTLLAIVLLPSGIAAQDEPGQNTAREEMTTEDRPDVVGGLAFVDRLELTVVNIDVFVTDDDGNAITGLTRDDFKVSQDGQERDLTHFAPFTEEVISRIVAVSEGVGESPSPAAIPVAETVESGGLRPDIKPVFIVIFIDNENLRPMDRNRVLTQAQRFLREVMYPHVQVMVVSYQRSLKVEQPFTNDSKAISDALRAVRKMNAARPTQDTERKKILSRFASLQSGGTRGDERDRMEIEDSIRSFADVTANELDFAINAVREVSMTLSGLAGRKYLIHVSSGLPMVPAKDLMYQYSTTFQSRSTLSMEARLNHRRHYSSLASAANSQGVTLYTIDASGLGGVGSGVSAEYGGAIDPITTGLYVINQQEPLQFMAEKTGGRAILSTNDITPGLELFRQDLFSYYSLGYTISGSGGDTVHRLDVELPEHPDYELNYRRSFVEKSLESKIQDRVFSGLSFDLEDNPMAVSVDTEVAVPTGEGNSVLPIEIGFPLKSIALVPEGEDFVGRVVVWVAVRDDQGRQSDIQRQEHEIRVAREDIERIQSDQWIVEMRLLMKPARYRIVVGVLDMLTRQASYDTIRREVPGGR